MSSATLPPFNLDNSETGCCPRFDPNGWDDAEFDLGDRLFVRCTTFNVMHVPLNMGSVLKKTWNKVLAADAAPQDEYLILSTDPSPWRGEHYVAVTKQVSDAEMATLPGRYLTRVFEGPYREAGRWAQETERFVASKSLGLRKLFFFYTTCPKCARHYGKNYVVAFAQV